MSPSVQPAEIGSADAVAQLAQFVLGEQSLDELLDNVVDIAKRALPGSPEVSITLENGKPLTMAASGRLALDVDERQYDEGHGPCLDAIRLGEAQIVTDMATETRWPDYLPRARDAGVASSISLPLPIEDRHIGALNCYSKQVEAFDDGSLNVARTLAGFVAVALANANRYEKTATLAHQLEEALASRAVIDQAKGMLMGQHHCDADAAFAMLVRMSQTTHRKLRDVAAAMVEHP